MEASALGETTAPNPMQCPLLAGATFSAFRRAALRFRGRLPAKHLCHHIPPGAGYCPPTWWPLRSKGLIMRHPQWTVLSCRNASASRPQWPRKSRSAPPKPCDAPCHRPNLIPSCRAARQSVREIARSRCRTIGNPGLCCRHFRKTNPILLRQINRTDAGCASNSDRKT